MVDPRFRGHHIMSKAAQVQGEWMNTHGILAMEAAAVTAHTRTQSADLIANIQLAFLPPIEFRNMADTGVPDRQTVVGSVYPVAEIPQQDVYAPGRDAEMLEAIYAATRLPRKLLESNANPSEATTQLHVFARADLGHAVLSVRQIGLDLATVVDQRVRAIRDGGIEVIYCDLPLDSPALNWASERLTEAGFLFAGSLPLKYEGVDALRYQSLGAVSIDRSQIHLKSPFAETLLDYVLAQLDEVPQRASGSR